MAKWRCESDGMYLESEISPEEMSKIKTLLERFSNNQRANPKSIANIIEKELHEKFISINTLKRFSKWCEWEDPSEYDAVKLSEALFNVVRLPRLIEQDNRPKTDYEARLSQFYKSVENNNQ